VTLVIFLMFVNWGLESWKWMRLMQPFCPIGFPVAFRAVMSGTTISLFTPNRVGEFAGRILHLEPGCRVKGVIATITGSMSQLLVTILMGCMALIWYPGDPAVAEAVPQQLLVPLAAIIPVMSLFIFFGMPWLVQHLPSSKMFAPLTALQRYDTVRLSTAVLISFFRYLVFAFQFYLVLDLFGIELSLLTAARLIAIIYLVMAIVPTMAISEIAVRGSVALYFLVPYDADTYAILAASGLLWLINLAVPAGMGALSALWIRINK
jgi:uncharacterized membrane protein YbhN (UPF0104 family)